MNDTAVNLLTRMLGQLPNILVCLGGGVAAMVMWKRSARACVFVAIAVALLLCLVVFNSFAFQAALQVGQDEGWDADKIQTTMTVLGVVSSCVHALAIGLLIAAAFVGRSHADRDA